MARQRAADVEIPKGIPTAQQVQIVARAVRTLQTRVFEIDVNREMNGHAADEIYAERGIPYSAAKKELTDAIERLSTKYKRLMPQVKKLLAAADKGNKGD